MDWFEAMRDDWFLDLTLDLAGFGWIWLEFGYLDFTWNLDTRMLAWILGN